MLLICAASSGRNLDLAHALLALAVEVGVDARLLDLTETGLPLYTPQAERSGFPPTFTRVTEHFVDARAYLLVAPEYNGSIPPTLTNTLAWLSRGCDDFRGLFNGRPCALATHSGGGGSKLMVAMRLQMAHLGCTVLGRELLTNRNKALNEESARVVLRQLEALMGAA